MTWFVPLRQGPTAPGAVRWCIWRAWEPMDADTAAAPAPAWCIKHRAMLRYDVCESVYAPPPNQAFMCLYVTVQQRATISGREAFHVLNSAFVPCKNDFCAVHIVILWSSGLQAGN